MVEAYIMVMTGSGQSRPLLQAIRGIDGVRRANIVAGEFDIIVDAEANTEQDLLTLVTEEIQSLDGVGRTRTCIILE